MRERTHPNQKIQPCLTRREVLGQPITRLLATDAPIDGAEYRYFGIEFASGVILNVSFPEWAFPVDSTTCVVGSPEYDLYEHQPGAKLMDIDGQIVPTTQLTPEAFERRDPPSPLRIEDNCLQNLIYYWGTAPGRHYYAILDTGEYLARYSAFNYTRFATARFRDWRPGMQSRVGWGPLDLTRQTFFDAWDHTPIDPFSVYG